MSVHNSAYLHATAIVDAGAIVEEEAKVWHFTHICTGAKIGALVSLGQNVYVDRDVVLLRGTRVQNGVSLYKGVEVGMWCFIGPHAVFTNDIHPRVGKSAWKLERTILRDGMSIGAGAIVRCGVEIGAFSMIGAGAVVTKDVPPFTLAVGLPAEFDGKICACGETRLPLNAGKNELIRNCCRSNLANEVLTLAEKHAAVLG